MTAVDRSTEPADVFDAHLARWEAAEADPDGTVERVARAIVEAQDAHRGTGFPCRCGWLAGYGEGWEGRLYEHRLYATAAAAIDALRPAPDAPRAVLGDIEAERARQDARWGQQNHPDGTGVFPRADRRAADEARRECQMLAAGGMCTWRAILAEEVAEAFAETDPEALRAELIQVAAVAVQWAEAIDRRTAS